MLSDILSIAGLMLAIFVLILAVMGGMYAIQHLRLRQMRAQWRAERRTVQFGPVKSAVSSSLRPRQKDSNGAPFGIVGIVEGNLIYQGTFGKVYNVTVPLTEICTLGRQLLRPQDAAKLIYRVRVDFQTPGGLQVYTFSLRQWREFLDVLTNATGLPVHDLEPWVNELPPPDATRMKQDIYGQWQPDFTDKLYLSSDRLVFAWRDTILLDEIRTLTLYDKSTPLDVLGALNPFDQDVLRIDYVPHDQSEADQPQVIGFQLMGARRWGERIAQRAGVPLMVHEGRKKI